jgi:tetratricopeptide (TPR) repeat protein
MYGFRLATTLALLMTLCGCAGSIEHWIVNVRVHQGDAALVRGNVREASLAYGLALRVDPTDVRAQAGYVEAAAGLAKDEYTKGDFEDAMATIAHGLAVDPQSVRLEGLKTTIEQARLKREIVISNYPTYGQSGLAIEKAYVQLDTTNKLLLRSLHRFGYTFDANDLTDAIKRSYELQLDISKNTNRLIVYRQLVTSGVPAATSTVTSGSSSSLLPLP